MADWIDIHKDPKHMAREKQKARALRQSQWWRNKIAQGNCAYCQGSFAPHELTMDHIVPLARGGRSTKGNAVPCVRRAMPREVLTPAELLLQQLREQNLIRPDPAWSDPPHPSPSTRRGASPTTCEVGHRPRDTFCFALRANIHARGRLPIVVLATRTPEAAPGPMMPMI